jgi:hypothetical protein
VLLGVVKVEARQSDVLQIVSALHPPGGLARGLNGRQQQSYQHTDNGDHHQ